jgi:hypothetical protein
LQIKSYHLKIREKTTPIGSVNFFKMQLAPFFKNTPGCTVGGDIQFTTDFAYMPDIPDGIHKGAPNSLPPFQVMDFESVGDSTHEEVVAIKIHAYNGQFARATNYRIQIGIMAV